MKGIIKTIGEGWHFARWVRLALALVLLVQFFITGDNLLLLLALFLGTQAVLNLGCCGSTSCSPVNQGEKKENSEIVYEEVK